MQLVVNHWSHPEKIGPVLTL